VRRIDYIYTCIIERERVHVATLSVHAAYPAIRRVRLEVLASYDVSQGLCRLKQRLFYYYLNCENKEGWDWLKVAPYKVVRELTPCGVRYPPAGHLPLIENAGWHFSFLGNAEVAMKKVRDYAHVEYNTPELMDADRVSELMVKGEDIFGRNQKYEFVEIDNSYPAYVLEHQMKLARKGYIHGGMEVADVLEFKRPHSVTASISTKDRYQTTLPLAISAVINQTRKPEKLKIYDDGAQVNLFELAPFDGLLKLAQDKGIDVEVLSTPREGQVKNHQHCLDVATTTMIWGVDDDEVPEPSCLEQLLAEMKDGVGAVAGLVHHPANVSPLPPTVNGTLNDLSIGLNMQWFEFNGHVRDAGHLYSTFLYSVEAGRAAGGYPRDLSPVGHREETIFTHSIKRAGYALKVTPYAKTAHLREPTGGIRSYSDTSMWAHDEQVFQEYLRVWGVDIADRKLAVLDYGLGDTLCFRAVLTELQRRNPRKWVLAVCFPEVFKDMADVTIISIAEAKLLVGHRYDEYSLYRWCWDRGWDKSIVDAMHEYYA